MLKLKTVISEKKKIGEPKIFSVKFVRVGLKMIKLINIYCIVNKYLLHS